MTSPSELETAQEIAISYDETVLAALSSTQNGVVRLETVRDDDGNRIAYRSWYPIDLSGYVAPAVTTLQQVLLNYASDRQNAILGQSWGFNVAASGAASHVVTTRLDDAGQTAMMKLGLWLMLNANNSANLTMPYSNVDSSTDTLTYAEVGALVSATGAFNIKSYEVFNPVCDQIRAGAITSTDQIDLALKAIKP